MAITMDCVVTNFWKLSRAIKSIWYHSEVCCFNRNPLISASSSFVQLLFCVLSAWLLYFIVIIMWAMNRVVFMVKGLSALFSRTRKTKSYWYKFFSTLSQQLCCLHIESIPGGAFVKISSCVRGKLTSFLLNPHRFWCVLLFVQSWYMLSSLRRRMCQCMNEAKLCNFGFSVSVSVLKAKWGENMDFMFKMGGFGGGQLALN